MDKRARNLEPYDLLNAVDVINTSKDITLSSGKHQNNKVLIFKKDIDGELTVLAEVRKKHGYLLVFDAWRKQKVRRRSDAVQAPPGTHALDDSPRTVQTLSDAPAEKSTPQETALFQLTRERELGEARKAAEDGVGREEFINGQLAYSAAMDEELPSEIEDEAEAREWLGAVYDEAAGKGNGRRNEEAHKINRCFTAADAPIKRNRLYSPFEWYRDTSREL